MDTEKEPTRNLTDVGDLVGDLIVSGATVSSLHSAAKAVVNA